MEIVQRVENLKEEFNSFSSWEDRYAHIIKMGKELPEFPEKFRLEDNKIRGCQSQVWLFPELVEGRIQYHADSDASIVKGIISLLLKVYSNSTPEEILSMRPDWLEDIGLRQHLSMSRANGLSSMLKQISMYALAMQAKIKMGIS